MLASIFGKKPAKGPHKVAPAATKAAAKTTKPIAPRPTAGAPLASGVDGQLITTINDFPGWSEVLSGVDSSVPELKIAAALQDRILAVKLSASATASTVVYDPAYTQEVKPLLGTFRNYLSSRGWSAKVMMATTEVIAAIRQSALANASGSRSSSIGGNSDGTKLFRDWVSIAKSMRATDLHLRVIDSNRGEVLVRVDGELEPIPGDNKGIFTNNDVRNAMKASFENLADKHSNSDGTFSEGKSMSCMMDTNLNIPNLRLRFSSQRGFFGPKAVARLLPSDISAEPMPFSAMGFSAEQINLLEKAQRLETGVVLQMGVTGSGKTTVAKTFLEAHPHNGRMAMYQVADPIEFLLRNVHQIYVQRDLMVLSEAGKKDPYSEVIESLMRMDPDVVDVGEVRDFISARALANVGKSGHLALGTLHADSLGGVINRLSDPKLGLTRQELTSGNLMSFISYQALVPLLCEHCKLAGYDAAHAAEDTEANGRYLGRLMNTLETKFGASRSEFFFKNPEGCSHCRGRGTTGLTICAEMMMPEDTWLDFAADGKDRDAMRWWRNTYNDRDPSSMNTNGKLVIEHTMAKSIAGMIDPRHIERFGQLDALEVLQ